MKGPAPWAAFNENEKPKLYSVRRKKCGPRGTFIKCRDICISSRDDTWNYANFLTITIWPHSNDRLCQIQLLTLIVQLRVYEPFWIINYWSWIEKQTSLEFGKLIPSILKGQQFYCLVYSPRYLQNTSSKVALFCLFFLLVSQVDSTSNKKYTCAVNV